MKVCTITCHRVYNYGASLQAFALQHYIESMGHKVEIIDYMPWFHRDRYNFFYLSRHENGTRAKIMRAFPPIGWFYLPLRAIKNGIFKTWGRKKAFDDFEKKYLNVTKQRYFNIFDLQSNPPQADCYVAGSDQIWNTYDDNGKDASYYLDFGSSKICRISYAASLATSDIAVGWEDFVKQKISNFKKISVREKTGVTILSNLGVNNVCQVVDPVFLLSKKEWLNLIQGKCKKYNYLPSEYILVYDFECRDKDIQDFAEFLSKSTGLKMVSVNDFRINHYADININDAGPIEFLNLINNANIVLCSSFHATAFSIIFGKEFYTFSLKGRKNSSRMTDLLKSLNLENRFNPTRLLNPIDYTIVEKEINNYISESTLFLKDIFGKTKEV